MSGPQPSQEGVETVRSYAAAQQGKSYAELVAFNEGVIAAALALGAYIEGAHEAPPESLRIMEAAHHSMTRVRLPEKLFPPKPDGEAGR